MSYEELIRNTLFVVVVKFPALSDLEFTSMTVKSFSQKVPQNVDGLLSVLQ